MTNTDPRQSWRTGYTVLLINPFLALLLVLTDPPRWIQIVVVLLILVLVAVGSSLLRRRTGGWRPSETVGESGHDER